MPLTQVQVSRIVKVLGISTNTDIFECFFFTFSEAVAHIVGLRTHVEKGESVSKGQPHNQIPAEKPRPSFRRLKRRLFFYFLLPAVLLVTVAGYLITKQDNGSRSDEQSENFSFAQVLKSSSPEILFRFIAGLSDQGTDPLPVRLEKLDQKIRLANRLDELNLVGPQSDESRYIALESRFLLEKLRIQNDLSTKVTREKLELIANASLDAEHDATEQLANFVQAYLGAYDLSQSDSNHVANLSEIRFRVESIGKQPESSLNAANQLFELIQEFDGVAKNTMARIRMANLFIDLFEDSEDPNIAALSETVRSEVMALRHETAMHPNDVKKLINNVCSANIDKAKQLINKLNESEPSNAKVYLDLVNAIMLIGHAGDMSTSIDLTKKSADLFRNRSSAGRYRSSFDYLEKSIGSWNQEISIHLEPGKSPEQLPQLVLILKPGVSGTSRTAINEWSSFTNQMTADGQLILTVVFLNNNDSKIEASELRSLTNSKDVPFRSINSKIAERFTQSFPVPFSPCLMLLDKENRLQKLNAPRPIMQFFVLELVGAQGL